MGNHRIMEYHKWEGILKDYPVHFSWWECSLKSQQKALVSDTKYFEQRNTTQMDVSQRSLVSSSLKQNLGIAR